MTTDLTPRQRQVLEFIDAEVRERGYPPSVREIGEAVGLASSATVHTHLAALQHEGYLPRDPSKPRAIQVHFDPDTTSRLDVSGRAQRAAGRRRRRRHRRHGGGERRGAPPDARPVHRERPLVHAAGAR